MTSPDRHGAAEAWDSGQAYEQYVGRWSRKVAVEFLRWLDPEPGLEWADVGCGTGALSAAVLEMCQPSAIHGIDASEGFVSRARQEIGDARVRFETGDAAALPWPSAARDVTVSGLVLNFVRDDEAMAREMARVTRAGGRVAAYVRDHGGDMQMMRHFWDAAIAVSPADARLDQAERFPLCQPERLRALFERTGAARLAVRAIDIAKPCSGTSTTTDIRSSAAPARRPRTSPASATTSGSASESTCSPASRRRMGARSSSPLAPGLCRESRQISAPPLRHFAGGPDRGAARRARVQEGARR